MRNPDRLDKFYDILKEVHKNYFPDWRFGQLIVNFQHWYGMYAEKDIFYLEEDDFLRALRKFKDWTGVKVI